jgi:hypothetical protein
MKKIDIRARGKMGIIRIPKTSVRITLEEKNPKDYYKMLLKGDCPTGIADVFKTMLHQSDSPFEKVKELSHMTTSKGRYYRKTQFKRMIALITKEYQKRGIKVRPQKIERNILDRTAEQMFEA